MKRILLVNHRQVRVTRDARDGLYRYIHFHSRGELIEYLRERSRNSVSMARLRHLVNEKMEVEEPENVVEDFDAHELTDAEVLERTADYIRAGDLLVAEEITRFWGPTYFDDREVDPPPAAELPRPSRPPRPLSWIEVKVVDDLTGDPLNWVRIIVKAPDGQENFQTTGSQGSFRIENIQPGTCDLRCDLKGANLSDTPGFVGMGEKTALADGESTKQITPRPAGTVRIANIEVHEVKASETLDSLAKSIGMTWKDLAKFNFGTDVPIEINKHLVKEVGCTRKTADGRNYMFDDSDLPGNIYLPSPWSREGLSTGQTHTIRVRFFDFSARISIAYIIASPEQAAHDYPRYRLESTDGQYKRELSPRNDLVHSGNYVHLIFNGLLKGKSYKLTRIYGPGFEQTIFEDAPFDTIVDQEREVPAGLADGQYAASAVEQGVELNWS